MTKLKKFRTHGGRYGAGKVHLFVYDSLNKLWYPYCVTVGNTYYGEIVDVDEPVTCKKCLGGI